MRREHETETRGHLMKRLLVVIPLFILLAVFVAGNSFAEAWWEFAPPIITSPAPNTAFSPYEAIFHSWTLDPAVTMSIVLGYEVEFANGLPYASNLFLPAAGGGTCGWDGPRWMTAQSYTVDHQDMHEPIYWRVRVIFNNGHKSNWAIGYYRVGDHAELESPPTILGPAIANYDRGTVNYEWTGVPGAESYDIAFSSSYCNIADLLYDLRDESEPCKAYVYEAVTTNTSYSPIHDCIHLPVYFMVRARFNDNTTTNWAITYHNMFGNNTLHCGDCIPALEPPVATEENTWGGIKSLFK